MRFVLALVLLSMALFIGCSKPAAPVEETPKAPAVVEETPEQIATKLRTPMAPLMMGLAGQDLTPEVRQKMLADTRAIISANNTKENGKQAIAQVTGEMEEIVRKGRDAKKWGTTMGAIELFEALSMGNTKFAKIKEQCNVYLKLPKITIKGFFNVDTRKDEIYVFLHVKNADGTQKNVKVRPGEEFEGCRFVRIIGEEQGIELEYLELPGEIIQIMK